MSRFSFHKVQGELWCERVSLAKIARAVGTPVYIYSEAEIRKSVEALRAATSSVRPSLHYAVKANSNLGILRIFKSLGLGFDVVSGGELERLLYVGAKRSSIVFSGVGKSREEIRLALRDGGIGSFNVESPAEMELLLSSGKRNIPVLLRFNPNVDAETHPHITTGKDHNKFGMSRKTIERLFPAWNRRPEVDIQGLSIHIGSQILKMSPFERAFLEAKDFLYGLNAKHGTNMRAVDVGGGLGIPKEPAESPPWQSFGAALSKVFRGSGLTLRLEPGRALVARAGCLLTEVLQLKTEERLTFCTVDAAMNDLIRPALYGATHPIWPVHKTSGPLAAFDVVGPVCESADCFASGIRLPKRMAPGDLLAVMNAGAYGFSMSSQYNSRPRAAEVLVSGSKFRVIRRREKFEDLIRGEN